MCSRSSGCLWQRVRSFRLACRRHRLQCFRKDRSCQGVSIARLGCVPPKLSRYWVENMGSGRGKVKFCEGSSWLSFACGLPWGFATWRPDSRSSSAVANRLNQMRINQRQLPERAGKSGVTIRSDGRICTRPRTGSSLQTLHHNVGVAYEFV